ncbi:flagellar biosynthesis protein FlaG [Oceanobacillus chungangensis]|uniref:Flagellar biosynthesis protein FlaG n=2 Tax=Oceanobacillus chungangensis TaxID=1229152 RepID=A0A3D8PKF8_9BACI|nr:flagellar biosynthesis protein FlaG [Oceanobacillus chungangensis]
MAEFGAKPTKSVDDYIKAFNVDVNEKTSIKENDSKIDKQDIEQKVASLNEFLQPIRTNLKFELHEKLDRYYVSVVDSITHEVIKEIPPKKMLDMYAELADFMGFLVDKRI